MQPPHEKIKGTLSIEFHLCGDSPLYDLDVKNRAEVLRKLSRKLATLQKDKIPEKVFEGWNDLNDLPQMPDIHAFDPKELFRYMERKLAEAFNTRTRSARHAGGHGEEGQTGDNGDLEESYSLAFMCSPGQCCRPGPPHMSCHSELIFMNNRQATVHEDVQVGSKTIPIIVPLQFKLELMAVNTHNPAHTEKLEVPAGGDGTPHH